MDEFLEFSILDLKRERTRLNGVPDVHIAFSPGSPLERLHKQASTSVHKIEITSKNFVYVLVSLDFIVYIILIK